jgi:hypothetical protein
VKPLRITVVMIAAQHSAETIFILMCAKIRNLIGMVCGGLDILWDLL